MSMGAPPTDPRRQGPQPDAALQHPKQLQSAVFDAVRRRAKTSYVVSARISPAPRRRTRAARRDRGAHVPRRTHAEAPQKKLASAEVQILQAPITYFCGPRRISGARPCRPPGGFSVAWPKRGKASAGRKSLPCTEPRSVLRHGNRALSRHRGRHQRVRLAQGVLTGQRVDGSMPRDRQGSRAGEVDQKAGW